MAKERYSKVTRRMWTDAQFRALSAPQPNARDLWQWLLTCPEQSNIPGLLRIGVAGIAEALEWPVDATRACLAELTAIGWVELDEVARLVWIPKRILHDPPTSPNVVTSWADNWAELPECPLRERAAESLTRRMRAKGKAWEEAFAKASGRAFAKATAKPFEETNDNAEVKPFGKPLAKPSGTPSPNQEQEQEQEQDPMGEVGSKDLKQGRAHEAEPDPPPPEPDLGVDPNARAIADVLARHPGFVEAVEGRVLHAAEAAMSSLIALDPRAKPEDFAASARKALAEMPEHPTPEQARRKLRRFVELTEPGEAGRARPARRGREPQGARASTYVPGSNAAEIIT